MSKTKTYIVNDQPTEKDALDFTPYVETLADIAQTGNTPLTIGVFGTWGSGKTSLMKMVKNNLPDDFTTVWFDAWKYDKEETLWRVFLLSVLIKVKEVAKSKNEPLDALETLEIMLYRAIDIEKLGGIKIDLPKLGGFFAKGTAQLALSFIPGGNALGKFVEEIQKLSAKNLTDDFSKSIQRERTKIHIEQVRFLEQFQDKFKQIIDQFIKPTRLVVFIDDLDRCLPEKSIEVLEAIKLFLDVEHCVFVIGLDQDVIARGIEMKYKEFGIKEGEGAGFTIEGIRYLEKIIQLPFQIPPVEQNDMSEFVNGLTADWPNEKCPKVFIEGLGDNPRQIKRTVNVFLMLWKLAEKRKEKLQDKIKPIRLAKVVAIQTVYPDLYNFLLKDEPRYLSELEKYYRFEDQIPNTFESIASVPTKTLEEVAEGKGNLYIGDKIEPAPALVPFLSRKGSAAVKRILTLHKTDENDANFADLPLNELKLYFTLTARVETPQAIQNIEEARLVFEPQIIKIPAGKFLMGTTKEQAQEILKHNNSNNWQEMLEWEQPQHAVDLDEYFISKYPITNREYQAFIKDVKYKPPRGWDGDQFPPERGGHPVVNVSWNDAIEYCKWLSNRTNKQYRLPTEAEWEKSARWKGDEEKSLIYPWGDEFDPKKTNSSETNIGRTSEVGQFSPQGDSSYGCVDMAGNVWEWCSDLFNEQEYKQHKDGERNPENTQTGKSRVLRGGSWTNDRWPIRCARRNRSLPDFFSDSTGFRVVAFPRTQLNLSVDLNI